MSDTLLWYTTRGSGAVSLLLLSGVVVLGILSAARFDAPGWPRFLTAGLHRNLSLTAVSFLTIHVVTAVIDPFTNLGWIAAVVPFGSYYRPFWLGLGTVAAELLVAILATSLLRHLIGFRTWRAMHWLAYASWPIAVVHGLGTGTDATGDWMIVIDFIGIGAVLAAIAGRRLSPRTDRLAVERARFRAGPRRHSSR